MKEFTPEAITSLSFWGAVLQSLLSLLVTCPSIVFQLYPICLLAQLHTSLREISEKSNARNSEPDDDVQVNILAFNPAFSAAHISDEFAAFLPSCFSVLGVSGGLLAGLWRRVAIMST